MEKRRLKTNQPGRGFSMIELLVVLAIIIIIVGASIPKITTMMRESRVRAAYEDVLSAMRRAHEVAVDRRRIIVLTFTPKPNATTSATITFTEQVLVPGTPPTYVLAPAVNSFNPETTTLPLDMDFILPAAPAANNPDGLGPPAAGTDYGYSGVVGGSGLKTMYFQVDGTVLRDSQTGAIASGVIYVGRAGDPTSNRAVSILGTTGRVKGWRLNQNASPPLPANSWAIY
ncbi:MAG TPA: prepilin-type N-terminal cleavage/methylation domain-containing protein [Terriglobales bacterium]|nr:prepilin-type N-terminal cleavage/methylation domain-containing protein [Terriglobales bacterium]